MGMHDGAVWIELGRAQAGLERPVKRVIQLGARVVAKLIFAFIDKREPRPRLAVVRVPCDGPFQTVANLAMTLQGQDPFPRYSMQNAVIAVDALGRLSFRLFQTSLRDPAVRTCNV